MNYFNKSFFKMALGFASIILLGLISLAIANYYLKNNADNSRLTETERGL